jgi:peptidoglycan/LPS O-acetylase OafA/YrhL
MATGLKPIQIRAAGTPSHSAHLELVDQLRGVAILMVLLCHLYGVNFHWVLPWMNDLRDFRAYGPESVLVQLFSLGRAGVPLFFVLSGFCIHWSSQQRKPFQIGRFLWQRFWRLYPAYLFVLVAVSLIELKGNYFSPLSIKQFVTHALLIHNYSHETFWGISSPFWSIAVEVQLYFLYPLLLVITNRAGWRGSFLVAGLLSLVWLILSSLIWGLPQETTTPALTSPFNTWIAWCLGAWIAECWAKGHRAFPSNKLLPVLTLFCFVLSTIYRPIIMFNFLLASVTAALWLDQLLHRTVKTQDGWLSVRLKNGIAWIGLISYSFYLWHETILIHIHDFVDKRLSDRLPHNICLAMVLGVSVAGSIFCAYLSFLFLEKPGIQLGRSLLARLTPSKAPPVVLRSSSLGSSSTEPQSL